MIDIAALPKVELHLHIEGTLEPELIFDLAARHGQSLPDASPADLRARYAFDDLQSFLDLYYGNLTVLRTAEDFAELTLAYLRRAATGGVRHAEVFFDPQAHLSRGITLTASSRVWSRVAVSVRPRPVPRTP
jgi:adenosine deaminase